MSTELPRAGTRPRTRLGAVAMATITVAALLGLAGEAAAGASGQPGTAATNAPGGQHRFTVSVGRVDPTVHTNWVRLASYSFTATNEVHESHWHWSQSKRVVRTSTGVRASGCVARDCVVYTANGFQSTSAPQRLHGTYVVTGSVLRITWDSGIWEEWTVTSPIAGKLAKLTFRGTNFGATHGFGYGSNAEWSTRASMAQIAATDHSRFNHNYYLWKTNSSGVPYIDHGEGSPFWIRNWTRCASSRCLGARSSNPTEYYLSTANTTSTDRRDTIWHWVTANADGRGEYCYTGNSHVKPMMQIIDSDGGFHGWVAVEASLNQTVPSQGTKGDDIGVFIIADV